MGTTVDHLSVDHIITVIAPFTDEQGVAHNVGETGVITAIGASLLSHEITIDWTRHGQSERMLFWIKSKTGPGIGRMKQFFEKGEYVQPKIEGRRFIPGYGYAPLAPTPPEVRDGLIKTDSKFSDAMARVWALAVRSRFDEASEQLEAIVWATDRCGDNAERVAEDLCATAKLYAFDEDLTVYRWLRDQGISMWYSWGSGATSGGEGTERARHIRAAEQMFKDLELKLGHKS